jgi:hypothetical protein
MSDQSGPADDLSPHPDAGSHSGANTAISTSPRYLMLREAAGCHVARDQRLDRIVSVRMASGAAGDALEREGRLVARLDHAGIPPIHDIERFDGGVLVVGRAVEGVSLAEAVVQARDGLPPPELATTAAAVGVMIKVCDALAAAHARHVVHRHLRSADIVLGWHGQVHVIGWSAAAAEAERPLTLRYVARSSAPATADLDDLPGDIRAVGACLFEALALRPLSGSVEASLSGLDDAAERRLPTMLRAVLRKLLASDGAGGYRSVSEVAQDLGRFLEGQVPQAYEPGPAARASRWLRRHRRGVAAAAVLSIALAAGAWLTFGREVQRYLAWGAPVVSESFDDGSWQTRWAVPEAGMFELRDGRLISVGDRAAHAVFRTRLTTPVAVEYTGEIMPGVTPGDLSVQWIETDAEEAKPESLIGKPGKRRLFLQAGAYENSYCAIFQDPGYQRVAYHPRHLVPGRQHRFRVEINDEAVTMAIDGEVVMDYRGRFPSTAGYLALYGYFPGKAFSDLRIYQRHVPDLVSPLAVGDGIFQLGHYAEAATAYTRIASSHRGRPIAEQAIFRKGLCEQRLDRSDLAFATWARLSDRGLRDQTDTFLLENHFVNQEISELVGQFEMQYTERPAVRHELRRQWQGFMGRIWPNPRVPDAEQLVTRMLRLRDQLFPDDPNSQFTAIGGLLSLGRAADVIERFPEDRWGVVQARLMLGQTEAVLALPWLQRDAKAWALAMQGDLAGLAELSGAPTADRARALCQLGRAEEALSRFGHRMPALIHLGRAGELLDGGRLGGRESNNALIALGRIAEAADGAAGMPGTGRDPRALIMLGRLTEARDIAHNTRDKALAKRIEFLITAEEGLNLPLNPAVRPLLVNDLRSATGWFLPLVAVPLLERISGDAEAGKRALSAVGTMRSVFGQRAWRVVGSLFRETGEDPLPGLPAVVELPAWTLLVAGMHSELAGDAMAAKAAYASFRALPMHQRWLSDDGVDPEIEWFVGWRLRTLAR